MLGWISFFIQCCIHMSLDVFPHRCLNTERFRAPRLPENFIHIMTVHALKDLGCVNPCMYIYIIRQDF